MIAAEGLSVELACWALGVSASGFYAQRSRPPSARALRHTYLTEVIRRVHLETGVPQLNAPEGIRTGSPEHETGYRMGLRSRCV